jgi:cyclophilin family peptidyl-prolyl cis-trans isomerase
MNKLKSLIFFATLALSTTVNATIVEVQTTEGSFQINLFDNATPETVANFLNYVEQNAYDNVVFHRLELDFVLQGGGFTFDGTLDPIERMSPIVNEPVYSNVRGTIAMAKVPDQPNSATSQWFINLADNNLIDTTYNLDVQNGGFTVFGQIIGDGMDLIDQMSQFRCAGYPLVNTTVDQCDEIRDNDAPLSNDQLITINSVIVIDSNTDTAIDLNPVENTAIDIEPIEEPIDSGSFGGLLVLLSTAIFWRRRQKA